MICKTCGSEFNIENFEVCPYCLTPAKEVLNTINHEKSDSVSEIEKTDRVDEIKTDMKNSAQVEGLPDGCEVCEEESHEQEMKQNESSEDYLETILMLSEAKPVVRSVDIANELGYKKSSVSVAMRNLRERGHIRVTDEGYIYLTETGSKIAEMIYERHKLISEWLIKIGVPEVIAVEDACRVEHDLSMESFEAIKKYIKKNSGK